jgi:signal transduction histidine kinase
MVPATVYWHVVAFGTGSLAAFGSLAWTFLHRDRRAALEFVSFLAVVGAWNLVTLASVLAPVGITRWLYFAGQFFQVLTPVTWCYFALVYTGYRSAVADWPVAALLALGVTGMATLESVPALADLTYGSPVVVEQPFAFVYWTDTAVSTGIKGIALVLATLGSGLILYRLVAASYTRTWQVAIIFVTTAGAILLELFEGAVPGAVSGIDYPALAVAAVGVAYVLSLYRYDLFGYTPVDTSEVIEASTAPVLVVNPEGRIIDYNSAARATFDDVSQNVPLSAAVPASIRDCDPVATASEGEAEVVLSRNGDEQAYRLYVAPLAAFGDRDGLAITLRDVTDQRRRQAELDLLNQILSRALRHNIRNEIDVVRANATDLATRLDDDRAERAEAIVSAADALTAISSKTRVLKEVVQARHDPRPVDLSALITDTVDSYRERYPDVSFTVDVPPECVVEVQPDVEHALRNLVENAAQHNPAADPTVEVSLGRDDGVALTVTDDGPGIPPEELAVLERREETMLEHGSGIGLWIVNVAIGNTDGTISYSTGSDGTEITVRLPERG